MKVKIVWTVTKTYDLDRGNYPDCKTLEDCLRVDKDSAEDDPALFFSDYDKDKIDMSVQKNGAWIPVTL